MFSCAFMLESAWKLGSWARILDLCRAAWYAEAMSQALHLVSTPALGPRIFCYSPAAAGMTLLGSFVGNVSASLLGYNYGQVMQGLWGYNAALSTLAVGRLGRAPVTRGRPGSSSRRCRERPVALTRRWRRAARWRPRASPSRPRACWMRWICPASPCPSASWRASALQQVTEVPQGQPKRVGKCMEKVCQLFAGRSSARAAAGSQAAFAREELLGLPGLVRLRMRFQALSM